ncbi:MAG: hypothetical protein DIU71_16680 [Proteobacteria bacterium]|nr:MAG: hypothetical protein DIU71_16680 [Pseudomonadota bacterium]
MMTPRLSLPSVTGTDVELRIAGPGSRGYAFLIDWHFRLVLALAWLYLMQFAYFDALDTFDALRGNDRFLLIVVLPAFGLYLLYHPVLEVVMRGRTPGKLLAGVRLVNRNGDIPGAGALLVRNVFRLIDSLPAAYVVGLLTVMFSAQHVRIGDLAAGTLLVFDRATKDRSFARLGRALSRTPLAPEAADLVQELLDRWQGLADPTRVEIARTLLARLDPATSSAELLASDSAELRARLEALIAGKAAT